MSIPRHRAELSIRATNVLAAAYEFEMESRVDL
jgi:hypothetical protein